jgi:hypothetical protein
MATRVASKLAAIICVRSLMVNYGLQHKTNCPGATPYHLLKKSKTKSAPSAAVFIALSRRIV